MRQLQVVGVSDDGEALLLGPAGGKASHRLRLDDKLRAAVRGQLKAPGKDRAESALTPKEMQARLREGASPEEVAKEAGIPMARVLPYAAPVIAERERIVEQARGAVLHRSRGPNGQRPLGELVDGHLSDTAGLKSDSVDWSARRRRDGAWVVTLAYAARGGRRTASWLWRPMERDLTALDASATRLAAEEAPATRRKVAKKAAAPKKAASRKAAPKTATGSAGARPAARKVTAAKPASKATTKAAPKATKKATPKPVAAKAAKVAKPARPATTTKPTRKVAKPRRAPRPVTEVALVPTRPTVVPDPVLEPENPPIVVIALPEPEAVPEPQLEPQLEPEPEPEVEPQPIVARRPGQRVPLPSWSDVLLGVAPPEISREAAVRRRRKSG